MRIFVQAKPRSKKPSVVQIDETHFVVAVSASPVDGAANEAIARSLAAYLNLAPTSLELISGHASKQKIFSIPSSLAPNP